MTPPRESECSCTVCVRACTLRPGWFAPGEAAKAAELLGVTPEKLFQDHLGVDYWSGSNPVFILAPAIAHMAPGTEYPFDPKGRCVFLGDDNRCQIHAAKPFECASYHHAETDAEIEARHRAVVDMWRTAEAQQEIRQLLGRDPEEAEGSAWEIGL